LIDKKKIIFRADGGHQTGMGHFIRTLALAEMLNDHFECVYATKNPSKYQISEIERVCHSRIDLPEDDSHFYVFLNALKGDETVVLDNYYFTTEYQRAVKSKGCKLVCIDDLHDKDFVADLIINYTPGIKPEDYNAQPNTQFALGSKYTLLRPEFLEQAKKARVIESIQNVMICFGGSDFNKITESTLKAIQQFSEFKKVIVVTGNAYQPSPEFQSLLESDNRVSHRSNLNSKEMLAIMMEVDLAVVPASSIAFEAVCAGCKLLVCKYADNQKIFYQFLVDNLNTPSFGDNSTAFQEALFAEKLQKIIENPKNDKHQFLKENIGNSDSNLLEMFLKLNDSTNMIEYKIIDITHYEDAIKKLFHKQPFGRYLSDRKIEKPGAIAHEWNRLLEYSKKSTVILAIKDETEVIGIIGFHFSEFDTDVFQKRMAFLQYFMVEESDITFEREIAKSLLDQFHDWVKDNAIQVVATKLASQYFSPIYVLQEHGYILYENLYFETLDISKGDTNKDYKDIEYRYARDADKDTLKEIALNNTFSKSHFYLDTKFSVDRVDLMYARWIENALKSDQKIVIVEDDKKIAGVFIYDIVDYTETMNKKFAVWKSAFVDSSSRGKGIGLKLFRATLQSCIDDGADVVDSSLVEKNSISKSFHDKLGFRMTNTVYTLHKWFD
jgi:UDP-2,4-diacetamido-2,4,6-trideoxy-beta-L-altropyranose hydrolase